ncbi:toll/interleukin-1 receptor domain-containing protein [Bosea sp. LjRoot9]|uniref:toll/interleukin-1 receptor domain-containing protein n=1 Tax=Bosea sp. LjRoot9 TaxID=3342341 RepID=UPI003F50CFB0
MPKLWLTYAWVDNNDQNVDFVIQQLEGRGIEVIYDRAVLNVGQRLWSQIDKGITDPTRCDAWAIFTTAASLKSEPCQEELAIALDRALRARSSSFPLIGIFAEKIDRELIPSAIATRLYVNLTDPDWLDRIAADLTGSPRPKPGPVDPEVITTHYRPDGRITLEIRPRTGRWYPAAVLTKKAERGMLLTVEHGPVGCPPMTSMTSTGDIFSEDGEWAGRVIHNEINAGNSLYATFSAVPSAIAFGQPPELRYIMNRPI